MRRENKNWTYLNSKLLRFGDLSHQQRKIRGIPISYTEAYLKCEQCDQELLARKHNVGSGDENYGWEFN